MAAVIHKAPGHDKALGGQRNALIVNAETNLLVTGPARLCKLIAWSLAASGITVDIYDSAGTQTNRVWSEVIGASATVIREFQLPMDVGLYVVTTTLTGTVGVNITFV